MARYDAAQESCDLEDKHLFPTIQSLYHVKYESGVIARQKPSSHTSINLDRIFFSTISMYLLADLVIQNQKRGVPGLGGEVRLAEMSDLIATLNPGDLSDVVDSHGRNGLGL
jgi:hypothetical protein